MGFIEETGAAQHYRDARILPIYEGTTAIQSNDLLFRKTVRDEGTEAYQLLDDISASCEHADASSNAAIASFAADLRNAANKARAVIDDLCARSNQPRIVAGGGVPYLMM